MAAAGFGFPTAAPAQTFDDAVALHAAGRSREALAAYRAVAASSAPAADRAAALNNACVLEGELGEHAAALADCEVALRLRQSLGDPSAVAETANNLGLELEALGRTDEAEHRFRSALAIDRGRGDAESVVVDLGNLGALALGAARYAEADRLFGEAAELAIAAKDAPWARDQLRAARINQGVVLEKVGDYRGAVMLYRRLLDDAAGWEPRDRASLLVNAGVIYRNLDDAVSALALFEEAARIYAPLGDLSSLSNVALNRALALHLNLGRPRAAEEAYREALALAERGGDRTELVQDLFYLGRLLLERAVADPSALDEAERLFERCLEASTESGLAEGRWSALEGLGRVSVARNELDRGLARLEGALAEIERVRSGLSSPAWRSGYFGDKRAAYGATIALLARLDRERPGRGFGARALLWAQRAKARDLLDALGGRGGVAPRGVDALRPLVGADVVAEYFVAEERICRWVLRRDGLALRDVGAAPPVLAAVGRVHHALAAGGDAPAADVALLSRSLLADVPLPRAGGELRIAPDGLLQYLPFELLVADGSSRPLVDLATVSYLPSALALAMDAMGGTSAEAPPERLRLAAFAGPADAAERSTLTASRREVAAIARRLGGASVLRFGDDATEAAVRAAVREHPAVLHFATHAVVEEAPGRGAAIVLKAEGADDGRLRPAEIATMGGGRRLTVLAACRTALADPPGDGRALASLTGAFLGGGSPAVVATLWDVDDAATAVVMEQLYAELARGRSPAVALRAVKERLRADRRWNRPAVWAGYVVVGRGRPVVSGRPFTWLASGAVVAMLAGLALAAAQLSGSRASRSRS